MLGRWFIVTGKLLKYLLFVFFPLLIVIALYTLITELSGLGEWGRFGGEIVLEGLMAFVAVMNLFAMNELYHSLVMTEKPSSVADKSISLRYWLLVALGAVSIIGAIIATVIYMEKGGFDQLPPIVDPTALEDQVRGSHTAAATYFETNGSYEGVCEEFNTNSIDIYTINCNDSSDAWATTILYGDEIWCADTETQAKLIKQPLGDRVKCLELPQ